MFLQVGAGRRGRPDVASRRDVVGGDRVEEQAEDPGADDVGDRRRGLLHAHEVGRVLHVGGAGVPGEGLGRGDLHRLPVLVAAEDVGVARLEQAGRDGLLDEGVHLGRGGPDVLQVDRVPVRVGAERVLGEVDLHRAGERVGHHEGRRGEVVRPHVRIHPALEVAVAREHGGRDDVVVVDRLRDRRGQRPGIADAGGAAEAHEVEAERVEALLQAGLLQVLGDDLAARRERGLHPGLGAQALGHRVAGEQPRPDHHARVRGVGAGGDRRDHHVAVADVEVRALDGIALGDLGGLAELALHGGGEARLGAIEQHPVLRALRPGERGLHVAEVEFQRVGEDRVGRRGVAPHALGLGVGLHQRDALVRAAGDAQEVDGLGVHREEAAGRPVFRRHVGDRGAVGHRHVLQAGPVELHELAHHALLAQHLRDGEHEVGGGGALRQLARELEPDHLGDQHRQGLAEHGGLRLNAADAPAEDGQAVDHRGVRVGADEGIRIGQFLAVLERLGPDRLGEVFEVDLVADAGAGRHHGKVVERRLAPLEEGVALAVALVFERDVVRQGLRGAELVDDDRVVDDEIDGHERVDLLRIAAQRHHGVAHRREVDDGGHAREVLHQHARGPERDLGLDLAAVVEPPRHGLDVGLLDGAVVLEAQQVLQQHLHREGQPAGIRQAVLLGLRDRVVGVGLGPDLERLAGLEAVDGCHGVVLARVVEHGAGMTCARLACSAGCADGPGPQGGPVTASRAASTEGDRGCDGARAAPGVPGLECARDGLDASKVARRSQRCV
ncbi:hypothetical protein GMJLKIPL_6346 [Methylobacterium isbiliense]|uniref:Uncharacterized protein n=1 Tax=Methylobacterium isbiliense TaxID=315478 RepID=A0ABQ4SPE9_9HYPH|nr:hypothetical protein GMJLKIPL_6346 [Methylobacterium isbiliense]